MIGQLVKDAKVTPDSKFECFVVKRDSERRERIATAALQGYLAGRNVNTIHGYEDHHEKVAKACLQYTDSLIAELDREVTP